MANFKINRKPLVSDAPVRITLRWKKRLGNKGDSMMPRCTYLCDYGWENAVRTDFEASEREGFSMLVRVKFPYMEHGSVTWRIELLPEECNYGGYRWWFVCPITGEKCANLYYHDGSIGSQKWLGLGYSSQLETDRIRAYRRLLDFAFPEVRSSPIKYPYRNGESTRKQRVRVRKLFRYGAADFACLGVER